MISEENQTIGAIDVHGHYGVYTDGKSQLADWCASAAAGEVAERARQANITWTAVSPLLGLIPRFGADAAAGNDEAARIVPATRGLLQWAIVNPLQPRTYEQASALLS